MAQKLITITSRELSGYEIIKNLINEKINRTNTFKENWFINQTS